MRLFVNVNIILAMIYQRSLFTNLFISSFILKTLAWWSYYTVTTGKANNVQIPPYFTTNSGWHTTSMGLFTKIKF